MERRDRDTVEMAVSGLGRLKSTIEETQEGLRGVRRRIDPNKDNSYNDLPAALAKLTEAEEAIGLARTKLNNFLQK